MAVVVHFPSVLSPIVGAELEGEIEATETNALSDALDARWPGLANHLFDSIGGLRPHVLCFIDGETARLDGPSRPIEDGSTIRIVQAISGG